MMNDNIHNDVVDDNVQSMTTTSSSMTTTTTLTTDILSAALDECGLGDFFANPVCVLFFPIILIKLFFLVYRLFMMI